MGGKDQYRGDRKEGPVDDAAEVTDDGRWVRVEVPRPDGTTRVILVRHGAYWSGSDTST